ncbi:MAG: ABC transporter ATP-binding protein [Burkholderiales bacterium]|nr:ABC transporter ATP-binding protein [Burkholderiales bacterium]
MLEVRNLHSFYGESHILHGVSLALPAGSSLGLLGRNGMGKTTLIKSIMGLVKPREGTVQVDGVDMTRRAPYDIARTGIAYVPEGRGIFANLSVRENLAMAARPGVDGRREWTLERVLDTFPRLKERMDTGGQLVSGGEQQMVAIGRALLTNPRLMILDEATEGLAPRIVADIWRVIGEVARTGISTLIVDRAYRTVLAHTHRAVVMEKGRVVLTDDSARLAADPGPLKGFLGV